MAKLRQGRNDIVGAAVYMRKPLNENTSYSFQARTVAYIRGEDLSAIENSNTPEGALKGSLDALERQVRDQRKKMGQPWKRSDLKGAPGQGNEP